MQQGFIKAFKARTITSSGLNTRRQLNTVVYGYKIGQNTKAVITRAANLKRVPFNCRAALSSSSSSSMHTPAPLPHSTANAICCTVVKRCCTFILHKPSPSAAEAPELTSSRWCGGVACVLSSSASSEISSPS